MMGLHQENEARLKVFMKVQINLVELTEFWGSVEFSVGTAELEPEFPQESHQENQVYYLVSSPKFGSFEASHARILSCSKRNLRSMRTRIA